MTPDERITNLAKALHHVIRAAELQSDAIHNLETVLLRQRDEIAALQESLAARAKWGEV